MSHTRRLTLVLVLNLLLVGGLVTVGLSAHSLGVLAAGGDYLADAAAIGVSLLAIWLARRPGGHPRATTIAAGVNAGWLLALSLLVVASSIHRLAAGTHEVQGLPVLIMSGVAAIVMVGGVFLLDDDDDRPDGVGRGHELNLRAVLLDTATDAAAAAGVAVSGAVILATGGTYWLDPAVALVIAVVVGHHALRLLRDIRVAWRSDPAPARLVD